MTARHQPHRDVSATITSTAAPTGMTIAFTALPVLSPTSS